MMKLKNKSKNTTVNRHLTVIIPVYNSSKIIGNLLELLNKKLSLLKKQKIINKFETILVNDCSTDNSLVVLEKFSKDKNIKIINLKKNIGQHLATICGLNYSTGNIFVTMDDDLQHDPDSVDKLLIPIINNECDACYAKYKIRKHSIWKIFLSDINNYFLSLLFRNKSKTLKVTSFRCFNKSVRDIIILSNKTSTYIDGFILKNFNRISQIDVVHQKRQIGKSNYTFLKLINLWLNIIFSFTYMPLRLFTFFGMMVLCFSLAYILRIFYMIFILNISYPIGWPSVMLSIFFFGGFIILGIGIIGEYLCRQIQDSEYIERESKFFIKNKINII